jgi:hypothetical protein
MRDPLPKSLVLRIEKLFFLFARGVPGQGSPGAQSAVDLLFGPLSELCELLFVSVCPCEAVAALSRGMFF